jgi:hypothetical protein
MSNNDPPSGISESRPLNARIWRREANDFYTEPEWCSVRLIQAEQFAGGLYDPACGSGRIVISALAHGLKAYGSDIADRGWDSTPQDFLLHHSEHDNIVTNVPFKIARPFVRHALELARRKVAMLFPLARLNAAHPWLLDTPLLRIWLLTPRPSIPPGRVILAGKKPGGGRTDFCWLVWQRGYAGKPQTRWLHRDHGAMPHTTMSTRNAPGGGDD